MHTINVQKVNGNLEKNCIVVVEKLNMAGQKYKLKINASEN